MQQVFQESDSGILINARKANWFIKVICILIILSIVLAISMLGVILFTGSEAFSYWYILAVVFAVAMLWYLTRYLLWNTYGKELIMFSKETITYTADFRLFHENKQTITLNMHTQMEVVDHHEGSVYLRLKHMEAVIETVILVPKGQFKDFKWENITNLKPSGLRPKPLD